METPQTATCTGTSKCWTRMVDTEVVTVSGGQLGFGNRENLSPRVHKERRASCEIRS